MENKEFVKMMFWCLLLGFSIANLFLWVTASKAYAGQDFSLPFAVFIFEALIILFAYLNERYNLKNNERRHNKL
jgi:hypothetical protein